MSSTSLLSEIIAQGGKVPAYFYRQNRHFSTLQQHSYLHEAGVLASVVCNECDEEHAAQVVYEDSSYGYYCPELGFVSLTPERLTLVRPDLPLLIGRIAHAFDCHHRKKSSILGQTWRIGAVATGSETVMLYFHPTLQSEDDARELQNALAREVRSDWKLVITCQGTLPIADLVVVRLDDVAELDERTGDLCRIADCGMLAGVPRKNPGGRPAEYGAGIRNLIEERSRNGEALEGRNEEAKAVLDILREQNPTEKGPALSSVKGYVTKVRSGQ